jgi:diaminohydroxyphosphoribosylaminopyrimidine deaminase/5-amino-6-(5-phosphoribosylamino)uracil reductase
MNHQLIILTMNYMERALELSRFCLGKTGSNPPVGAVLVRDGFIVGEGCTEDVGGRHAEIVAIEQAGSLARGSTLYVTLEPCCHFGKTPPCTNRIIDEGIEKVFISVIDPNVIMNGASVLHLKSNDIEVVVGNEEVSARQIMEGYLHRISTGLPFVTIKFAMSLDGKIATADKESKWITNEKSRQYSHFVRSTSDAILVGINTVLTDNPKLSARNEEDDLFENQPLKVIFDSKGRTPLDASCLEGDKEVIIFTNDADGIWEQSIREKGVNVIKMPGPDGRVDVFLALEYLGWIGINSILVEGGGTILSSFFQANLVQKVEAFIAPVIIGGENAPSVVRGSGAIDLASSWKLNQIKLDWLDGDIHLAGYVSKEG